MKYGTILLLVLFNSGFNLAQVNSEPVVEIVNLKVYNPTDKVLTLLVKNRYPIDGELPTRFTTLTPKDTTLIPFEIISLEDRVPSDDYVFNIYEAPDYYYFEYHQYWFCELVDSVYYNCLHALEPRINVIDSLKFDSIAFVQSLANSPIIADYDVDTMPVYAEGLLALMQGAREIILAEKKYEDVHLYVQFVVEKDGTVTGENIIKTSDDSYNEAILAYFSNCVFSAPGWSNGIIVRTKMTLPVGVKYK